MYTSIVWFRQDLRLADHPALQAALARGGAVLPLYIDAAEEEGAWATGGAGRWWLRESLRALAAELTKRGSRLLVRRGPALSVLQDLVRESSADAIFWTRRYEPALAARDRVVQQELRAAGLLAESRGGRLLAEPEQLRNQSGAPFQVFTPYWRAFLREIEPPLPLPAPATLPAPRQWPRSEPSTVEELIPQAPWMASLSAHWQAGERPAHEQLQTFIDTALERYPDARDRPALAGTSRLSPRLQWGELTPRQIWHAVGTAAAARGHSSAEWRSGKYLAELIWREFSYQLLHHWPSLPEAPMRAAYESFPWREDAVQLQAWQRGRTGIPLIDAGMRELWASGWMHNRVRMVVASFLVKNLRIHWRHGARWFLDTLVDADLANNTQGWQWSAGCGADAAPYFRIFNPVSQGQKFDPEGHYVRRWLPELAALPVAYLHAPWLAPPLLLAASGVTLGVQYPRPIVDLALSRRNALGALQEMHAARR
ncbi:MAG: deoxyribodipyrimidine photo-lyase [Steroidobacteraceae bacterium]|jgi:deoxyribodipyrimidine photo-lyase